MFKKSRKRTLFEMSELSKIEADDDVTQAYLLFKKKDYKACLQIFEENFVILLFRCSLIGR